MIHASNEIKVTFFEVLDHDIEVHKPTDHLNSIWSTTSGLPTASAISC